MNVSVLVRHFVSLPYAIKAVVHVIPITNRVVQLIIAETGQTVFVRSEEVRQATRQDYTGPRMKAPDKPASAKINRCHIMATQDANGKVTRGPALTDPSCQK